MSLFGLFGKKKQPYLTWQLLSELLDTAIAKLLRPKTLAKDEAFEILANKLVELVTLGKTDLNSSELTALVRRIANETFDERVVISGNSPTTRIQALAPAEPPVLPQLSETPEERRARIRAAMGATP